jgi:hypothetical protein
MSSMDQPPVPVIHANRLLDAFGYWHSFHDAEVHRAVLDRGGGDDRPSVTLLINVYDSSGALDERGYYDVRVNVMVSLRFTDVEDLELSDLGTQNVINELRLEAQSSGRIAVELGPCFGLNGVFTCRAVEVLDVVPYSRPAAPSGPGSRESRADI